MSINIIVERKLKRIFKVLKGTYFTIADKGSPWESGYWDEVFYIDGISDAKTISSQKEEFSSRHHYASVETLILRYFINHKIKTIGSVLDLGSGAGHWIDFYLSLRAKDFVGIEVSEKCVLFLEKKYASSKDINIKLGKINSVMKDKDLNGFDLASAIGVLFHIVEDDELLECLNLIYKSLNKNGLFIMGGNFGIWPMNINTQIKFGHIVNKRLRSKWWWKRNLANIGFKDFTIYRNTSYAFIKDRQPENSVLICKK
jgi:SAM-dependent methyltransferase